MEAASKENISDKYQKQKLESEAANKSELKIYLEERDEMDKGKFDILQWWKDVYKFPILSSLTRDVVFLRQHLSPPLALEVVLYAPKIGREARDNLYQLKMIWKVFKNMKL